MFKCVRDDTPCLPLWWILFTQRYSLHLVVSALLLTAGVLTYTIFSFKINANLGDMVSDKLHFRRVEKAFRNAFPELTNTIVVLIEAETPEHAQYVGDLMANRLKSETHLFKTVYLPGGGDFFEKNGLLFMSVQKLEELTDHLAEVQALTAILSEDLNLRGFFSVLEKVVREDGNGLSQNDRLLSLFDQSGRAIEEASKKRSYQLSWQELVLGRNSEKRRNPQFLLLQPFLDYRSLCPAEAPLTAIHGLTDELRRNDGHDLRVRITGSVVLNCADLMGVRKDMTIAASASILLVGIFLYWGLGSIRLVFISIATLIIGLIWSMGLGLAFFGSLNTISIAFVILFIGLGIDYSIQFCLRYRELIESGHEHKEAIQITANGVGNAILLCSVTTAIGFYAFVPTAYTGASELGLIAGTSMFINSFTNLTVLPALLNLIPPKLGKMRLQTISNKLAVIPDKATVPIGLAAVILAVVATTLIPKISFDFNPLNLSDPSQESVRTAKELFKDSETSPWRISVLTHSLAEAKALASRIGKLPEVEMAITIADFVPGNQSEKLDIISDMALFMPSRSANFHISSPSYEEKIAALKSFEETVKHSYLSSPDKSTRYAETLLRLYEKMKILDVLLKDPKTGRPAIAALEEGLMSNLPMMLDKFETLLQAKSFGMDDLPRELVRRFVSADGKYRIEVFPHENLSDVHALERFVAAVRTVAPEATDSPVTILESGKAIVSAFKHATLIALIGITIFLLVMLRRWEEVVFVLIPLFMAILFTGAASVLLNIPFNFANLIVVPLLLGTGVDYSIHMMYRFRTIRPAEGKLLQTSTARAVFFSALTTIMSFGTLSFVAHRGTASIGILLTICVGFMILCTMIVLPAFLKIYECTLKKR
jgi:hopanoid biosynthesis associated RND transporter like protein HpnN